MKKCPGQDKRFWKPEDIFEADCPHCQAQIEFWKDEIKVKCPKCKQIVTNHRLDLGCAEWCQYAEECLNITHVRNEKILCTKLIEHMKQFFGKDSAKIDRVLKILNFADQIQLIEKGDPLTVKAVAILLDMHRKSTDQQDYKSKSIASNILRSYGIKDRQIQQIYKIINSYNRNKFFDCREYKIIHDAITLINMAEVNNSIDKKNSKI